MLNSVGWIFIVISLIFLVVKQAPGVLIVTALGAGMIWLQLRGKRINVDTAQKTIKSGSKTHAITSPTQIFINEVRVSQNVNSRVQSSNVKMYFYKAYLQDEDEKILLSSNRKEERDLSKLKSIADDLRVELVKNY